MEYTLALVPSLKQ